MADQGEGLPRDRALLDTARSVLAGRINLPSASRVRAAAVLGRSAVEHAAQRKLRELTGSPIGTRRTKHQMICLGELTDGAQWARDAYWAWTALSGACHEHAYELEPTQHEVEHLLDLVEHLVTADVRPVVGGGG